MCQIGNITMIIILDPRSWNLFGSMASLNWGFLRQVLAASSETLPERDYEEDECVHDDDGRKEVDAFLIFVIFSYASSSTLYPCE